MTAYIHHLEGCSPTPLASYLKAIGILRLVAEQVDAGARGWWQDERFFLVTSLDRQELERFFLDRYAPTPFVSPWNKASGFFHNEDPALTPLERSSAERFAAFRAGIQAGRAELAELSKADAAVRALKDSTKSRSGMSASETEAARRRKTDPEFKAQLAEANRHFAALKADLFTPCARSWRGPHRAWLDAALVLQEIGKPAFPSLLGTGGNDGRLDFTNNAMQRLGDLFDLMDAAAPARPEAKMWLTQCLWGAPTFGMQAGAAIGQFSPGQAGGANSSTGAEGDSLINPWDFVLMLEGCIMFSARSTRRLDPLATSRASAPFTMHSHGCGHASPGQEKASRGEQWMPLWSQPTTASDLAALIGEARLQTGRTLAHRPLDAARAIATLGTARGILAFERFGYLERNGQSNLAIPLGRIDVRERPEARLIDDLAGWLDRLDRQARGKTAPARLIHAERRLADAVFAALTHDHSPDRWQAILCASQQIEAIQVNGTAFQAGPMPRLSPQWLDATNDNSAEWRLACALGSAAAAWNLGQPTDPVRIHWLPIDPKQPWKYRTTDAGKRLAPEPRKVVTGRDAIADAAAVVERRLIEASRHGSRALPLIAAPGMAAAWGDLAAFLDGAVDWNRTMQLAQALMALDWVRVPPSYRNRGPRGPLPEPAWLALRICCLAEPLPDGRRIPCDPALVRRLRAGDASEALAIAIRRLRASGIRPPLQAGSTDPSTARRWAAALLFPITPAMAEQAVVQLAPASEGAFRD
jgi:CRISPR-associated protein Csx17